MSLTTLVANEMKNSITRTHEYIEQSADDLRYCLVGEIVDPSQFTVIREASITWQDFEVAIKILGESHYVSLKNDDNALTEICACTDITNLPIPAIHNTHLNKYPNGVSETINGFSYTFKTETLSGKEGNERLTNMMQKDESALLTLQHQFITLDPNDSEAVTAIVVRTGDATLHIETAHTYPSEGLSVFTKSILSYQR